MNDLLVVPNYGRGEVSIVNWAFLWRFENVRHIKALKNKGVSYREVLTSFDSYDGASGKFLRNIYLNIFVDKKLNSKFCLFSLDYLQDALLNKKSLLSEEYIFKRFYSEDKFSFFVTTYDEVPKGFRRNLIIKNCSWSEMNERCAKNMGIIRYLL